MLALMLLQGIGYAPAQPWALGFSPAPRLSFVADVDGDGLADLVSVSQGGDSFIDVIINLGGQKTAIAQRGISNWGKDCQAAAVGKFDNSKGASVVGIFGNQSLRLATGFNGESFTDVPDWLKLPKAIASPQLCTLDGGKEILAFSMKSGDGYEIQTGAKSSASIKLPGALVWLGDEGDRLVGQQKDGSVVWIDKKSLTKVGVLGKESPLSRPGVGPGIVAFADKVWTPSGIANLQPTSLPPEDIQRGVGTFVPGGGQDIAEFREGSELYSGSEVLLRPTVSDSTLCQDSSNDGLPDAWKLNGFRGLDFKAMGCKPGQADVVCLVSRFKEVPEATFKAGMDRVISFYKNLKVNNPDGTTGVHFHPIFLDPISGDDEKNPWWANRDKFLPAKWRGVVHWMQVTPGGGGQADQMGNGGTCGQGALWAVFVHEFGHQMGLDHQGFWPNGSCPIYTSLMNYNYSYGYEDDMNKIHYSDGSLSKIVLDEADLNEVLPYSYEKVKFLEKGPYHFRLKPNGATTLIDWNWNGVFGENHVRANINYAYSISAGERQEVAKTKTAPMLMVLGKTPFLFYGVNDKAADPKTDPSLSVENPGALLVRDMTAPKKWSEPTTVESGGLIGDPVATSAYGALWVAYPTQSGVMLRRLQVGRGGLSQAQMTPAILIDPKQDDSPSIAETNGRLCLFLWNPTDLSVRYSVINSDAKLGAWNTLDIPSTNPIGVTTDTITGETVLGVGQDQDKGRLNRWQIRRYRWNGDKLAFQSLDWVDGVDGSARGQGRLTLLFESGKDAGPHGRVYLFGRGYINPQAPWSCEYVAVQIADKTVHGGWLTKRYYDEWTQSRSVPSACWFNGDIMYAYRWVDTGQGASDNILHVAYNGSGIDPALMGDHDDLGFIRNQGIRYSILQLSKM